jgi:hypothetical protein
MATIATKGIYSKHGERLLDHGADRRAVVRMIPIGVKPIGLRDRERRRRDVRISNLNNLRGHGIHFRDGATAIQVRSLRYDHLLDEGAGNQVQSPTDLNAR